MDMDENALCSQMLSLTKWVSSVGVETAHTKVTCSIFGTLEIRKKMVGGGQSF